ncbi:MAG TPA: hypothetical protein VF313_07300 [Anaerolineaceae bacterium]
MSNSELKDTQPTGALQDTQPNSPAPVTKKGFPRWLVAFCLVVLVVIGLLAGYGSGMGQRYAALNTQLIGQLDEQFQLGKQAMEAGNYQLAKQYFDWILSKDPNFPGIQAAYSDLQLLMQVTPTPVFSPTPLISPTPDLRAAEEIYNTALQLLNSSDWNGAITNLDSLRKSNPTYRTAEVDGMYYMALRQRGVSKIVPAACKDANFEGGIYDLTLAEHFVGTGNLDSYADSLRTYARFYIQGASFWDQDWLQAQYFFSQVMLGFQNLSDSSCMSATKRWVQATLKVAEQLQNAGDYCAAAEQYALAFAVNDPLNAPEYPDATQNANQCPSTASTPTPTPTPTP